MITEDFIINELSKVVNVKKSGQGVKIPCPFHNETEPSLQISLGTKVPAGIWYCFGCKEKGHWNSLAERLGLTQVGYNAKESKAFVNKKDIKLYKPIFEEELDLSELNFTWKRYSAKFLNYFGARRLWHEGYADYFIFIPITFLGDYQGFIRVRLNPKLGPKYWINLENKFFYPFDFYLDKKISTIVLVEGLADVYRLIKNRIPALTIFGTTIPNIKDSVSMLKTLCIKNIILCMDGDLPGKEANLKLKEELSPKFNVEVLQLPFRYKVFRDKRGKLIRNPSGKPKIEYIEKCDPDDMDKKYLKILRKMVLDSGSNLLPKLEI